MAALQLMPKRLKLTPMPSQGLETVLIAEREPLLRFLRARGAGDAAEDILQDLWLRLSALDSGPIADPRGYLFRAANNVMHDRYRSAQRARQRDSDWISIQGGVGDVSDAPLPDRQLIARATLDQAEAMLRAEGDRVLQIFRMFRIEGIGQRQIARDLGLSLSAVEKDLQKAYRALIRWREIQDAD
jgi:RNA polymerase sigma-70 factor (ECF subfamily)